MEKFKLTNGSITSPKGYKASGIYIGIKKKKKDLVLIVSDVPAEGAAVFTTNKVCAAPVIVCKEHIKDGKIQAVIVNSGNANACTGEKGLRDAYAMAEITGKELCIPKENVLVSSTGVIGVPLPMDIISKGIPMAVEALSYTGSEDAVEGIMTTDTCKKQIAAELEIDGLKAVIGGIAKGSGMIHPNMATMLAFITTDVKINGAFLDKVLKNITDKTYNMITVDGDTSTNDMVCVMANGLAGNNEINESHPEAEKFIEAFAYVNEYLAKSIVRDGEGATKFIEAEVLNAISEKDARMAIKSVLNSNLVKTAFFGEDGNWGRIVCSIGYSGAEIDPDKIDITLSSDGGTVKIVENGRAADYLEEDVSDILSFVDIKITIDLQIGTESATGWGCDLSYDYVKINGAYRT